VLDDVSTEREERCLGGTGDQGGKPCTDWVPDIVAAWDITVFGLVEEICPESVFRLSSAHGGDLILKNVGNTTSHNPQQLRLEYKVLLHVHEAGLPVAVPLPDKQGRIAVRWGKQYYSLAPCLPHAGGGLMPADHDQLFRNYGRTIAQMHRALATFPQHRLGEIGRADLESEVFEIGVPIILRFLPEKQADEFQAIIDDLTSAMRSAFPHLPEQLIHRDCHAGNLLSCGTEVTGIVDWDHLTIGPRILDIAYFAVQLAKHDVHDPKKMAQWVHDFPLLLQGYECESPLSDEEKSAFPYVLISVPILFAYWAIETSHDDSYIQTELDTVTWLHSRLALIQESVQAL
jgi:Ser/Thr protein kinase RdoA (MazF antagonist)